jgi:hypothetical protein
MESGIASCFLQIDYSGPPAAARAAFVPERQYGRVTFQQGPHNFPLYTNPLAMNYAQLKNILAQAGLDVIHNDILNLFRPKLVQIENAIDGIFQRFLGFRHNFSQYPGNFSFIGYLYFIARISAAVNTAYVSAFSPAFSFSDSGSPPSPDFLNLSLRLIIFLTTAGMASISVSTLPYPL